jgi:hemolysin-activating ACP:hemolysin acyltransferase
MFGRKSATPDTAKQQQAETPPVQAGALNRSAPVAAAGEISAEEAKKRAVAGKQIAAAFGELVTMLMRSPADKHHTLGDLEWLVVPALAHRQYALAEAQSKETGAISPVGGVLWALVSEEVDKRLSDLSAPVRLKPNEWRSGDIPWIVLATGDKRILAGLIEQLSKTVFKDRAPKMRARGADGKVSVGVIEVKHKDAAA